MPRATRSKKIVIAEDDAAIASQVPLPATPRQTRPALAEISHNPEEETMTVEEAEMAAQLKSLKAAYKTAIGGKKNKKGKTKKVKEQPDLTVASGSPGIVDDQRPVVASSAAEGARQMLGSEEEETPSAREGRKTPPSPAVREARQRLKKTMAGQFDNDIPFPMGYASAFNSNYVGAVIDSASLNRSIQDLATTHCSPSELSRADISYHVTGISKKVNEDRDRGVEEIKLPMKGETTTLEAVEKSCERQENGTCSFKEAEEDSFVEKITTRSPTKPVARIEDSIETIDKLEEAIEALGQAAVTVSPRSVASAPDTMLNANTQARATKTAAKKFSSLRAKPQGTRRNIKTMDGGCGQGSEVKKSKSSLILRNAVEASDGKVAVPKKPVKRPASLLPPKEPVKSTKPVTRPAFELPGEAVSRKKREAYEARLKAEEEEEKKRREFKARPVRNSVLPGFIPRETVASRARKSQVCVPEGDSGAKDQPYGTLTVGKRASIVGAHRPSIMATTLANTSAPRAPGPPASSHPRKASTPSGPSMSGLAMQRTVSASEVQLQRQRAKEIYNRDMKALEEMEKEKREREAAAKKSRLEAAERGRLASREWAEKQRVKKAAEGDKNKGADVGPSGQAGPIS